MFKKMKRKAVWDLKDKAMEVAIEHFTEKDIMEFMKEWMKRNNSNTFNGRFESATEGISIVAKMKKSNLT